MELCGNCKHFDEKETSGQKGYCTYHGIYVYADDYDTCSHYDDDRSGSGGGLCFLTTACCALRGLPDDCRELSAMRRLRDDYLNHTERGRRIVADYYREAPGIVEKIDASPQRNELYAHIYDRVVTCANLVEADEFADATDVYLDMVNDLKGQLS